MAELPVGTAQAGAAPAQAALLVDHLDALLVASRRQQAHLRAALLALVAVVDHD